MKLKLKGKILNSLVIAGVVMLGAVVFLNEPFTLRFAVGIPIATLSGRYETSRTSF